MNRISLSGIAKSTAAGATLLVAKPALHEITVLRHRTKRVNLAVGPIGLPKFLQVTKGPLKVVDLFHPSLSFNAFTALQDHDSRIPDHIPVVNGALYLKAFDVTGRGQYAETALVEGPFLPRRIADDFKIHYLQVPAARQRANVLKTFLDLLRSENPDEIELAFTMLESMRDKRLINVLYRDAFDPQPKIQGFATNALHAWARKDSTSDPISSIPQSIRADFRLLLEYLYPVNVPELSRIINNPFCSMSDRKLAAQALGKIYAQTWVTEEFRAGPK
jgi:hypothetical protein